MSRDLELVRGIVDGMSDPAILLDRDLKHVCHSRAYAVLSGMRLRALVKFLDGGGSPFEVLGADPEEDTKNAHLAMNAGKAYQFVEQSLKNRDGAEFICNVTYLPIADENGKSVGLIQSLRDVSAEARVQVRYRELLERERVRAENLEREVQARTRDLTAALEEVTRLSRTYPLTSLLNRRAFTELAEMSLKLARRHKRSVGLLIGDLDFFKKVNDTYGHQAGDKLLVATSAALQASVRDTDPVARFGGEEFVVLLTETAREAVALVGNRIRESVQNLGPEDLGEDGPTATMSLGMAIFPDHGDSLDELISRADQALYRAKEGGRNRVEMFDPDAAEDEAAPNSAEAKRRLLIVGREPDEVRQAKLASSYDVVAIASDALGICSRDCFDAILADHDSAEDAVEFLRRSLRFRPESLRIMVIDSEEVFVEVRGSNLARVDSFLLRGEVDDHLQAAIDDGLARREMDRQRILLTSDSLRRVFSTRVNELEQLIEERQFDFAYQPIVDPRTRVIVAYEALCRAKHPVFCNATVLFDAAVQSGTLWQLGRVTRELAMQGLAGLDSHVKLFVNLHPGEVDDPELFSLADRFDAARIVFEITERAAIPNFARFKETSQRLSASGYEFAIDDLGAGYASLNAVALLAPEFIKIDMTMIRGLHEAPRRARLVRRVVDFANDIGIQVIAEGIEVEEEAATVADVGCHLGQGYYFGRPGPLG